jgi:outer membrane protein OmpA-like peptidoglycan-associated protein
MTLRRSSVRVAVVCALPLLLSPPAAWAQGGTEEINLLSWGAGALVVQSPPSESTSGQWSTDALLDELKDTGWANKRGDLTPKAMVFELAQASEINSLAFDTAQVYSRERSAKDVTVDISDRQDGGFIEIARISLAAMKDGQKFPLKTAATGRYIKLTVFNNYGDSQFMEIMNIYAYGKPLGKRPLADNSGTFSSDYGNFHIQQIGITVTGCYEHSYGLIESGGFDGRVLRFTWSYEPSGPGSRVGGPAIIVFSDDGKSFIGHWWHKGESNPNDWNGKRISKDVGSCPNWKPGTGNQVEQQLKSEGRARLYGILFDTDSDHIKDESKPALDSLLAAAHNQPSWNFSIEGHTDNIGSDAHNQTLSEKRVAAVKAYLIKAGVDEKRLATKGFGASKPVASNDTSLGRSENRRVEIVKQ